MRKYGNFLYDISAELNIKKDITESESAWKCRVIYSAVGRQMLASLWDRREESENISIIYLKRRMIEMLNSYCALYPEIKKDILVSFDEMAEIIYNRYKNTGNLLHSPYRISPCPFRNSLQGNISFLKGVSVAEQVYLSGLGLYQYNRAGTYTVEDIFGLQKNSLASVMEELISQAEWKHYEYTGPTEYLIIKPPFSRGYWKDKPDINGEISMLRIGMPGQQTYFLYRYENGVCKYSQLPSWKTYEGQYRNISTALLYDKKVLPAIVYKKSNALVYVSLKYLFPPAEQDFFVLYSWPRSFLKTSENFNRCMDITVFDQFRKIMEKMGYSFTEESSV